MTLALRKNGNSFPTLMSDFFEDNSLLGPDLFNLERNMMRLWDLEARLPSANIIENDKSFKVELAVPGLQKADFKINIEDGCLNISAEKKEEKEESGEHFKRREFAYNAFSRSFQLPDNTVADKVDARYDNGILSLVIPKKEADKAKPRKEIKVG